MKGTKKEITNSILQTVKMDPLQPERSQRNEIMNPTKRLIRIKRNHRGSLNQIVKKDA